MGSGFFDAVRINQWLIKYKEAENELKEFNSAPRTGAAFEDHPFDEGLKRNEVEVALNLCRTIQLLLNDIAQNIDVYNSACQFNGSIFGSRLDSMLDPLKVLTLQSLLQACLVLYRFYRELNLVGYREMSLEQISFLLDDMSKWTEQFPSLRIYQTQIKYVENMMPAAVVNHIVEQANIGQLKKIKLDKLAEVDLEVISRFDYLKAEEQLRRGNLLLGEFDGAERAIKKRMKVLEAHSERIESYTESYNFIGLSKAFSDMSKEKSSELSKARNWVVGLGVMLIIVPILAIVSVLFNEGYFKSKSLHDQEALVAPAIESSVSIESSKSAERLSTDNEYNTWFNSASFKIALPLLSIEFIFLYFFRLKFQESRSVSGQILQISYRKALCQFVQEYATYSKALNEESPGILQKFESVVFSPIVANESEIPHSFDGFSQVAEFIGKMRK